MRDLRTLSGPWIGWWIQGDLRGRMRLTLRFGEGVVEGGGADRDGAFHITGEFSPEGAVRLVKRYLELAVIYDGRWDDPMIYGPSTIGISFGPYFEAFDEGRFEIWPEGEEESLDQAAIEEFVPRTEALTV